MQQENLTCPRTSQSHCVEEVKLVQSVGSVRLDFIPKAAMEAFQPGVSC
jgi:hypothetical protein